MAIVWLLQDAEILPIDKEPRLMRTGLLAERLLDRGHQVVWVSSVVNHAQHQKRAAGSGSIELIEGRYILYLVKGVLYRTNFSPLRVISQTVGAIDFLLSTRKLQFPDVIVASYPSPELSAAGAFFASRHAIPLLVDIRDAWPSSFVGYCKGRKRWMVSLLVRYYSCLLRFALSKSSVRLASASAFLEWSEAYRKFTPEQRKKVIYLGYQDALKESQFDPSAFDDRLEVVFVASFGQSYDGMRLVSLARELELRQRSNIRFTFVGDGEGLPAIREAASDCSNIQFLGWVDGRELSEVLQRSHIGVMFMKEFAEIPAPNKFFEYTCFGLGILSSIQGEVAKLILDNEIGVTLVGNDNTPAIEFLQKLEQSRYALSEIRKRSRALFTSTFEADKVYDEYVNLIEEQL